MKKPIKIPNPLGKEYFIQCIQIALRNVKDIEKEVKAAGQSLAATRLGWAADELTNAIDNWRYEIESNGKKRKPLTRKTR